MEIKKRNVLTAVGLVLTISIAFILDLKYKGLIYRILAPRKVQS